MGVRGALGWPSREIIRPFWQKRAREPNRNRTVWLALSFPRSLLRSVAGQLSLYEPPLAWAVEWRPQNSRLSRNGPILVLSWSYPGPILVLSSLVSYTRFAGPAKHSAVCSWSVVSVRTPTRMGGRMVPSERSVVAQWPYPGPVLVLSGRIPGVPTNESAICGWSGPIGAAKQGRGDGPCNWCHQW